ncbi:hypothetical protein COCON_G00110800 [Conger conger]|uniref:Anoctamin n=1 Tax=Conger conger TaxID=82655 RepID=A0A9Q1DJK2_CONCO|nr:hypothetical protein COCON_G00110800 [Conger conger]
MASSTSPGSFSQEAVAQHCTEDSCWVLLGNRVYDVTEFLRLHLGGEAVILRHSGTDVSQLMSGPPHRHSENARRWMEQYYIGDMERNCALAETEVPRKRRRCPEKAEEMAPPSAASHSRVDPETDLVDWQQPLAWQVGHLGEKYDAWVHQPVDRPLRLFQSPLLEATTKTSWYMVPLVWIPVVFYLSWYCYTSLAEEKTRLFLTREYSVVVHQYSFPIIFLLGMFLWTFLEYCIHRFVFHMRPPAHSYYLITIHFLLHGQHHKSPFDRSRLVFPPGVASPFIGGLYLLFTVIFPEGLSLCLFTGGLGGYVVYDLIHYYLHYGSPQPGSYLYGLKAYHVKHHFKHQRAGFGITTSLWDHPFSTVILEEPSEHDGQPSPSPTSSWFRFLFCLHALHSDATMTSEAQLQHRGSSALAMALKAGSWTPVSCPCCHNDQVEPLVMIQLAPKVKPATKKWIISRIEALEAEGGAQLLAHPGEDSDGDVILVAAPRCTLLRVTEDLGLCKPYKDGSMAAFSYQDRDSFKNVDNMQEFLTAAERQFVVKYELDSLNVEKDQHIPGMPLSKGLLQARESIIQKLQKFGVVLSVFPLHDQRSLDDLAKSWYTRKQLWGQPLDSINAYFGGMVAFYFSFLDFYTWALVLPAALGLVLAFLPGEGPKAGAQGEDEDEGPSVRGLMVQAVFSMLWSTVVMELWKRRSSSLSYYWGTLHLAERFAEPRPGFHGTVGQSPITGRMEPLFPEWRRKLRIGLVSAPVVGLFLGMVVLGIAGFYWGEAAVQGLNAEHDSLLTAGLLYVPSLTHILYVNVLGTVYGKVSHLLTEWENHREESAFQNHLTVKALLFTFFNYFAILFHIAFFKQDLPLLRKRLSSLLIVTQLVSQCTEVLVPFLVDRFFSTSAKKLQEDDPEVDRIRAQTSLPPFPGLFSEYIELLVQYGYLSLFSCVYPLTAVFLLLNNVTEMRTDAFKICRLFQKPFSAPVASMGVWQAAFEILGFVSVISNCWLLLLSPRVKLFCQEGGFSSRNALLFAILIEHILILIKMILSFAIPDEPDWIRKKRDEIEFHSLQALNQQKQ